MHLPIFWRSEKAFWNEFMVSVLSWGLALRPGRDEVRTSSADSAARARSASCRLASRRRRRICALTEGIDGKLTLSSSTPRPRRIGTARESLAMPPQTPTHLPRERAPSTVCAIRRSTAGLRPSTCGASFGCPRSIASVYCVRSLVPIEKKSASRANCAAMIAAAGTSTMMPTGMGGTPRLAASSASIAFTSRSSSSVATIGNITLTLPKAAARRIARSCVAQDFRTVEADSHPALAEERIVLFAESAGRRAACHLRRPACG